jgi:phenylacetate-CoA ligase
MSFPHYFESFDYAQMRRDFPLGDDFAHFARSSRDSIHAHQEKLFLRCVARAWEIPFYQRLWRARGLEPGDIRTLADIVKLPVWGKSELMRSLAEHPPYGDYHGWDSVAIEQRPVTVLHTTSGTTGRPQVVLFSPRHVKCKRCSSPACGVCKACAART